jgi:hypothetical protein
MKLERKLQVLYLLNLALQELYFTVNDEPKTKTHVILLTCQYGGNYKVKPTEVKEVLDKSISQLLFKELRKDIDNA